MTRLPFKESQGSDGLWVYTFIEASGEGGEARPVRSHWPGLFADYGEYQEAFGYSPWTEFCVNNNNMEELLVYLAFAWRLTEGLRRFAIPAYYRDEAASLLGRDFDLVDWEYGVDAEKQLPGERDLGFTPARSRVPFGEPSDRQSEHRSGAGLFELTVFKDLVELARATTGDASAEITLIASQTTRSSLGEQLRGSKPSLDKVLTPGDVFVDITIGVDLGYYDSIIVKSRDRLKERIEQLAREYEEAIMAYEQSIPAPDDLTAFRSAMNTLAGVENP